MVTAVLWEMQSSQLPKETLYKIVEAGIIPPTIGDDIDYVTCKGE